MGMVGGGYINKGRPQSQEIISELLLFVMTFPLGRLSISLWAGYRESGVFDENQQYVWLRLKRSSPS